MAYMMSSRFVKKDGCWCTDKMQTKDGVKVLFLSPEQGQVPLIPDV